MGSSFGQGTQSGRWGSGEGAEFGSQRYGGSYGYGYSGQGGRGSMGSMGSTGSTGSTGSSMGRFSGRGPKGYQRSDERIKEQVSEKLEEHGEIDAGEIIVEVRQAEVTLEGTVPDRQMKRMAEDIVEECAGVKQVHNRIRVQKNDGQGQGSSLFGGSQSGSSLGSSGTSSTGTSGSSGSSSSSRTGGTSEVTSGSEKGSRSKA
jgi:hypothetical protein